MTTAAGIIIGDEILSGKVTDANTSYLIGVLQSVGVALRRVVLIRDELEEIAREVRLCSAGYDYVFTSGGVGPTHDDRTMEGIARAFDRPLVRHPLLEELVRKHWDRRLTDAALKLSEVPEGAQVIVAADSLLPAVRYENVFILPGIPRLFQAKLDSIRPLLAGSREALQSIYLAADETSIAATLSQVVAEHPRVHIGSYPRLDSTDYRVRVTLEGPDQAEVEHAARRLLDLLPPDRVVRVEK